MEREIQSEIEEYRARWEALKSTWLAANQNFLYFQKMASEDLEQAKEIMTESQLETWENLRKRDAVTEGRRDSYSVYANGETIPEPKKQEEQDEKSKFKLVKKLEIDALESRLQDLNRKIEAIGEVDLAKTNGKIERTETSIENLYALLEFENSIYERELDNYSEIETNFRDLEEAVQDRVEELSLEFNASEKFRQLREYDKIINRNKRALHERLEKIRESRKSQKREAENARKEARIAAFARSEFQNIPEAKMSFLNASYAKQRLEIILATEVSSREKLEKVFLDDRAGIEENINKMLIDAHERESAHKEKLDKLEQLVAEEKQFHEAQSIERSWHQENLEKLKKDYLQKKKEKEVKIKNLTAEIHLYKD